MKYNIPLSNLEKIANPFKQISLQYLTKPLEYEEIEELMSKGNLFPKLGDNERDLLLKEVANKIINFNDQELLSINVDEPYNVNTGWIVENVAQLAALIYLNENNDLNKIPIPVNIIGDNNKAKNLFSPLSEILESNAILPKPYRNSFDWIISEDDISLKWSDKDFVVEQTNIKEIIKNSSKELWDDANFLNEFFSKYSFDEVKSIVRYDLPQDYLLKKSILKFAQSDAATFLAIWERVTNADNINANKKEKIYKEILPALSNKDVLENLLYNINQDRLAEFAEHISMELRVDEDIEEKIYRMCGTSDYGKKVDLFNFFPKEYFEDKVNFVKFLDKVVQKDIVGGMKESHIFSYWRESKERVLSLFDKNIGFLSASNNLKGLFTLYKLLPEEVRENKEVITKFLENGVIDVIGQLEYKHQADQKLIEIAILKGYNGWHLTKENIFKIKNPEAQKKYLANNPEIVKNKNFPKSWLDNPDNVLQSLSHLTWKDIPDSIKDKINSDSNFAQLIVDKEPIYYEDFNFKMKLNPSVAASFIYTVDRLNSDSEKKKLEKLLPKAIWYNPQFCLNLIEKEPDFTEDIPQKLLNDKNFILELFKLEDDMYDSKFQRVIDNLPKEINIFLSTYEIKNNYSSNLHKIFLKDELDKNIPDKNIVSKNKKKI